MWKLFLQLHFAVLLAGFTGVFGRLISYDAFTLVFFRFLFATVIVFMYVSYTRKLVAFNFRQKLRICFVGSLLAIHLILFYLSIKLSNVSIGTITIAATCFFTTALEPLIIKTPFKKQNLLYGFIIVLGLLLIFNFDTKFRFGIAIGFVSALFSSLFSIYNKKFTHSLDAYTCISYEMLGGFILTLLVMPMVLLCENNYSFEFNNLDMFYLFALASVFTVYLYLLVIKLSSKLSAFTINLTFNLEPIYAIFYAMLIFNESSELHSSFYAGMALVILSVVLQNRKEKV